MNNNDKYNWLINYLSTTPEDYWDWAMILDETDLPPLEIKTIYKEWKVQNDDKLKEYVVQYDEIEEKRKADELLRQQMEYNKRKQTELQYRKYQINEESKLNEEDINFEEIDIDESLAEYSNMLNAATIKIPLLDAVLSLNEGSITSVLGTTNSGKSTFTAHLLSALIPQAAEEDSVILAISLEDDEKKARARALTAYLGLSSYDLKDMDRFKQKLTSERLLKKVEFNKHTFVLGNVLKTKNGEFSLTDVDNCLSVIKKSIKDKNVKTVIIDYYQAFAATVGSEKRLEMIRFLHGLNQLTLQYDLRSVLFTQSKDLAKDEDFVLDRQGKEELQVYKDKSSEIIRLERNAKQFTTTITNVKSRTNKIYKQVVLGYNKDKDCYCSVDDPEFINNVESWSEGMVEINESVETKIDMIDLGDI